MLFGNWPIQKSHSGKLSARNQWEREGKNFLKLQNLINLEKKTKKASNNWLFEILSEGKWNILACSSKNILFHLTWNSFQHCQKIFISVNYNNEKMKRICPVDHYWRPAEVHFMTESPNKRLTNCTGLLRLISEVFCTEMTPPVSYINFVIFFVLFLGSYQERKRNKN